MVAAIISYTVLLTELPSTRKSPYRPHRHALNLIKRLQITHRSILADEDMTAIRFEKIRLCENLGFYDLVVEECKKVEGYDFVKLNHPMLIFDNEIDAKHEDRSPRILLDYVPLSGIRRKFCLK